MTYREHIVAVLKVDGHILREDHDTVTLPFGAEYSIMIKNLNSVRVQAKVSIDGKDVTDGARMIIHPNSSLDLERYIHNGNMNAGNRFKFIERTPEIEEHRGAGIDDGIIRVETWAEVVQPMTIDYYYQQQHPWRTPSPFIDGILRSNSVRPTSSTAKRSGIRGSSTNFTAPLQGNDAELQMNCDAGITVPGSVSNQQFFTVSDFPVENQSHVLVLKLRGSVGGIKADRPVTVHYKPECSTCGRRNKANSQYCSNCGTALVLI